MSPLRRLIAVVAVPVTLLSLSSCSDDDAAETTVTATGETTAPTGATDTVAPEDVQAPAAEVTVGLGKIAKIAAEIAAAVPTDKDRAQELVETIEPVWATVEGTVKTNDEDVYITFEDTFALLKAAAADGDAAKAAQGATDTAEAVAAYLARFPG